MGSRGYERSSAVDGWQGTPTHVAALAGRMGEVLGGSEVASVVITDDAGRRHEFAGPNQLRAVADTIDAASVKTIEILGMRRVAEGETSAREVVSVRANQVNERGRSAGLELRVTASTQDRAASMLSDLERAAHDRVVARRRRWIGFAAGRASFSLTSERRRRPTRIGRIGEALIEASLEAMFWTVVAAVFLVLWRPL